MDIEHNRLTKMITHEGKIIFDGTRVIRVPNGWIYQFFGYRNGDTTAAVFVPEVQNVEISNKPKLSEYQTT